MMQTFIDQAVRGMVLSEEIEDYVHAWHQAGDSNSALHDYLGMTRDEYAAWALNPDVLPHIITAHREARDFREIVSRAFEVRVAARTGQPDQLALMQVWLDNQN